MAVRRESLRDSGKERNINRRRVTVAGLLVCLAFTGLAFRYYTLQVVNYEQYLTASERNRVRLEPLPPARGLIYDRQGRLIASNQPSHRLGIIVERAGDLDALLTRLGQWVALSADDLEQFALRKRQRRPYDPVPLKLQLTDEEMALLAVNRHELPGVTIEAQLTRLYPYGELVTHAVGYVGRINASEEAVVDEVNYRGTLHIGKVGLERTYEDVLHGTVGSQNVETNAHGRNLRVLDIQPPVPGADLRLHLDVDLQRIAHDALGDQRGAVVVLDARSGGVLALVSKPAFDGNLFVNGISAKDYAILRESVETPLLNRAVQGQYPPGSTVKPMLAIAGLEQGLITPETLVPDPGWYRLPGDSRRYRDWILRIRGTGHAPEVDLQMAIAESCDVYYYDLARRMGIDQIAASLAPFGFGLSSDIDITSEKRGILPSRQWKRDYLGQPWYPGETLSVGIGQGYMLATPVQVALATMVVANRGVSYRPQLVAAINDEPVPPMPRPVVDASEDHWALVIAGMMDVVHSRKGTAARINKGLTYTIAGKTGTSQVIGIAQDAVYDEDEIAERHRNHGWFAAFAPVDEPEIVIAVLAENGGGSSAAYPVARTVLDAYFEQKNDV
jgi:penicillin-binding protein 2